MAANVCVFVCVCVCVCVRAYVRACAHHDDVNDKEETNVLKHASKNAYNFAQLGQLESSKDPRERERERERESFIRNTRRTLVVPWLY